MAHLKSQLPQVPLMLFVILLLTGCSSASPAGDSDPAGGAIPENLEGGTTDPGIPAPPASSVTLDRTPDKGRIDVIPRLSGALNDLYHNWQTDAAQAETTATRQGLQIEGDRVFVTLTLEESSFAASVTEEIEGLNGEVTSHFETLIDAWIPIPSLEKLASVRGILTISQPASAAPSGD